MVYGRKGPPEKYPEAYKRTFCAVWNNATCTNEVAAILRIKKAEVAAIAQLLRNQGFDLISRKNADNNSVEVVLKPPETPTNFAPGSAEKMAVIMKRIEDHEQSFHPDDATSENAINRVPAPRVVGDKSKANWSARK